MSRKGHDFTGLKLGHLTVIEPTDRRAGCNRVIWRCDCDCGNTIYLDSRTLKRTKRRDCGCNILNSPFVKDLTGQRFGKLICLYPEEKRDPSNGLIWHCRCDCGTIVIARQPRLESGLTTSCGCTYDQERNRWRKIYDGTSISSLESITSGKLRANNKSGVTGVSYNSRSNRWKATITLRKKVYWLGSYRNKEDAIKARKRAEEELYGPVIKAYYKEQEQDK